MGGVAAERCEEAAGFTWIPQPSSRTLSSTSILTTLIITNGQIVFSTTDSGSATVRYDYTNLQDFSTISTIQLINTNSVNDITATLRIFGSGGVLVFAVVGTPTVPINGTLQWIVGGALVVPVEALEIVFNTISTAAAFDATDLTTTIVCLARDILILMSDDNQKTIQDLRRGDQIKSNNGQSYPLSRLVQTRISGAQRPDIVHIPTHLFGHNQPDRLTITTAMHPILYKSTQRPARCFCLWPGVKYYPGTHPAKDIMQPDSDGYFSIYNLQFDEDVLFYANNLVVQSANTFSMAASTSGTIF